MNQYASNSTASLVGSQSAEEGQVSRELQVIEKQLHVAHDLIDGLQVRLSGILLPPEVSQVAPSAPEPVRVELAERIVTSQRNLNTLLAKLESLTARIEL